MVVKENVQKLIDAFINEDESIFLVSLKIGGANQIQVFIDSMHGVTVQKCAKLSRYIEEKLDRDQEDFSLKVSSAGLEESFKVFAQYKKNIGRKVKVNLHEGQIVEGVLLRAEENKGILLETKHREKVGGKKKMIVEQVYIDFQQIDQTKIIISF